MGHFHTFLSKSIVKTDFDPYFLVRFPYRNRGENGSFSYFPKQKYRED